MLLETVKAEKASIEVQLANAQSDADNVTKAASHSCMIYASQLGKPIADYEKMSTTALAKESLHYTYRAYSSPRISK